MKKAERGKRAWKFQGEFPLLVIVLATVGLAISPFVSSASLPAQEWHGKLETIYYPVRTRIYNQKEDMQTEYANALLYDGVQGISNPALRYYGRRMLLNHLRNDEGELKTLHRLYQGFQFAVLNLGSKNASFFIQGRLYSAPQERQPEASLRQVFFKYRKAAAFLPELKIGRILASHAGGLVGFDGGYFLLKFGRFYIAPYGGVLIDNDYLHKSENPRCERQPLRSSCVLGGGFLNEDYDNKWKADDVRNVFARERRRDSIGGIAVGYAVKKKVSAEVDYQQKTDAGIKTEEIGGFKLSAKPSRKLYIYGDGKANLIKGRQHTTLAGFAYTSRGWRYNPEYEYYRPNFKAGSFWENFHVYPRAAVRMNLYRFIGRRIKIKLSAGVTRFLEDDSKSENLTTKTVVDPATGEVIGSREQATQEMPLVLFDILGYPVTLDPNTLEPRIISTRPMTLEEYVLSRDFFKPDRPRDGVEGSFSVRYRGPKALIGKMILSTLQGPEGHVHKALFSIARKANRVRVRAGVGVARFQDIESDEESETAVFLECQARYDMNKKTRFYAGAEFYADKKYSSNTRGKFGFRYVF